MNRTWQLATAAVVALFRTEIGAVFIGGRQGGVGGQPAVTSSPTPKSQFSFFSLLTAGKAGTYALDGSFAIHR